MSKFMKNLFIINGLIIVTAITGYIIYLLFSVMITKNNNSQHEGVKNNNEIIDKKGDTIIFQGVNCSKPMPVNNSSNFYITITPKFDKGLGEKRYNDKMEGETYHENYSDNASEYLNLLFLDKYYNVMGKLVNKKVSIERFNNKVEYENDKNDKTIKNLTYLIAFYDTNKDGYLNSKDNHDLYISDLEGKNLVKATENIDVVDYYFINKHKDIFIIYKLRENNKEEYLEQKYAIYNIALKLFKPLTDIEKNVTEIVKILNQK